jgi:hypothetical protein
MVRKGFVHLAAALVAHTSTATGERRWEPGIPTGWEAAPGKITDFPHNKGTNLVYTIDPWLYSQRLGLYVVASLFHWSRIRRMQSPPAHLSGSCQPQLVAYFQSPNRLTSSPTRYKTLLASATSLHFDNGWGNPLWGLPLQFSWQHDTGRLLSSSSTQDIVNTSSWWGGMNYFLSGECSPSVREGGVQFCLIALCCCRVQSVVQVYMPPSQLS